MPLNPGPEFRVNNTTTGSQDQPDVIRLAGGSYVVTWANGNGVVVSQVFTSAGNEINGEVLTSGTSGAAFRTAPMSNGGFVIALDGPSLSSSPGITLFRHESGGAWVGNAIPVEIPAGTPHLTSVTGLQGGGFAVAWEQVDASSTRTMVELLDASGAKITGPTTLATSVYHSFDGTTSYPREAVVTQLNGGDVVVAWRFVNGGIHGSSDGEVYFQRFSAAGAAIGGPVSLGLDTSEPHSVGATAITATTDGGFAIGWSEGGGFPDNFHQYVGVQKFTAGGAAVAPPARIETHDPHGQGIDLVATNSGGFRLAYANDAQGGMGLDVYEQAFNAQGAAVDGVVLLSTTTGDQGAPDVANDLGDNGFLAAWTSTDGDGGGIYARLYSTSPPPPTVFIDGEDTVTEGNSGASPAFFTVTRSGDTSGAVSVDWAVSGIGSFAADAADFVGGAFPFGRLDFAPGETTKRVQVDIAGDTVNEPNEAFAVILSNAVGATLGRAQANRIIVNDDPAPNSQISLRGGASSVVEGNSGLTTYTFTFTRTGDTSGTAEATWQLGPSGSNAAQASDFQSGFTTGTVTFAPGETSKTASVNIVGDTAYELDEGFKISLLRLTGATVGASSQVLSVITNDDPNPNGGDEGHVINSPGPGSTLTGGPGNDTLNASQGSDVLTGGGGADTFAWAREPWSPATVTDFVVGTDRIDLSALFAAAGYQGSDPVGDKYITLIAVQGGTGILFDHDGTGPSPQYPNYIIKLSGISSNAVTWNQLANPPAGGQATFNIAAGSVSHDEGNSGSTAFTFVVNRTGSTVDAGHVQWSVSGNAGSNGFATPDDFTGGAFPNGTIDFAPGETSKTLTVNVAGDTTNERDELFFVNLVGAQGGVLGSNRNSAGSIVNDDAPTPGDEGVVINSPGPGSTLTGGAGNDTLNASQGADTLRGNGGADAFVYAQLPWSAGHVVDFAVGTDRLDISNLFRGSGYAGSDPIADGYVTLQAVGDSTLVLYDTDGRGSGNTIQFRITTLDHVSPSGLTWAQLAGNASPPPPPPPPPPGDEGRVINSSQYGDTLTGGSGNDTLNAGQGPDRLTGNGGADHFVYAKVPWNAGHAVDFTPGTDVLDLRGIFSAAGYSGSDPVADHWLTFASDGAGTRVLIDTDGPGGSNPYQFLIAYLDGVAPSQIHSGDWLFR